MKPEFIGRMPDDKDLWLCICGNHIWEAGFYPCLPDGREASYEVQDPLYCCGQCGRIINPQTLEAVGLAGENLATL